MSIIRAVDVSHVRFTAPDLVRMRGFLDAFGLDCFEEHGVLYGRGSDGAPFAHVTERGKPTFVGIGLRAESRSDLEALAEAENVHVEALAAPGGGDVVRLHDPDGNQVEVVAGQAWGEQRPHAAETPFNSAAQRRRFREPVRLAKGPSHVRRLGHVVLNVRDFPTSEAWYKDRFGFITSDEIEAAPDLPMGAFMRCDRGDQPTDHHTLFLAQLPTGVGFNHAAFEVSGFDDLMLGHAHLKAAGHKQAWGVGRHKLGSQIFDYWKDPWGRELEHWTDGDLFNAADEPRKATVEDLLGVQWGMPFPALNGRLAPNVKQLGFVMATSIRLRRLFRRKGARA